MPKKPYLQWRRKNGEVIVFEEEREPGSSITVTPYGRETKAARQLLKESPELLGEFKGHVGKSRDWWLKDSRNPFSPKNLPPLLDEDNKPYKSKPGRRVNALAKFKRLMGLGLPSWRDGL